MPYQQQNPRGIAGVPGNNRNAGYQNQSYPPQNQRQRMQQPPQQQNNSVHIPPSTFFADYTPEQSMHIENGIYRFKITKVETAYTQTSHVPMIIIEVKSESIPFPFNIRIAKTEFFNIFITVFFDCFSIEYGNDNFNSWLGCEGNCRIEKKRNEKTNKNYFDIVEQIPAEGTTNQEFDYGDYQMNNQNPDYQDNPNF